MSNKTGIKCEFISSSSVRLLLRNKKIGRQNINVFTYRLVKYIFFKPNICRIKLATKAALREFVDQRNLCRRTRILTFKIYL